jgi:hypothetical protein
MIACKLGLAVLLVSFGAACGSEDSSSSTSSGGNTGTSGSSGQNGGSSGSTSASGGTVANGGNPDGGPSQLAPGAVNLGAAGNYVVLAKSGISTVPTSAITGNLGVSPAAGTSITGFALTADATAVFSTSAQVTGRVYAPTDASPTPTNVGTGILDMQSAFTDAAGRAPTATELGAGKIGGMTLAAGVYKFGTGLLLPTDVTLSGKATDVWIFQVAQNLTVSKGAKIVLAGGALAKNVFWQVSGLADLDTTAHLEGVLMSQTSIALHSGASINGRLFAQTAVTLEANAVNQPAP